MDLCPILSRIDDDQLWNRFMFMIELLLLADAEIFVKPNFIEEIKEFILNKNHPKSLIIEKVSRVKNAHHLMNKYMSMFNVQEFVRKS